MSEIDDLVAVSHYAGRDVLLAQGGGGNTSVKSADGGTMWIKASGRRLAQMAPGRGYLATSVPALRALLADPHLANLPRQAAHEAAIARTQAATRDAGPLRPSLETTFHAVLGRVVLHTHPVYVNAFACLRGGQSALSGALAAPFTWVPYATPGYALGRAVASTATSPCATLVLENHGLICAGETPAAVMADTERFVAAGQRYFGALPDGFLDQHAPPTALADWAETLQTALAHRYRLAPGSISAAPATRRGVNEAATDPERWLLGGPLVPDDVVYGGHRVYAFDPARSAATWLDDELTAWPQTGRLIIALPGLGVVLAGPSAAFLDAMEENLLAHVLVRRLIARRGQPQPLPDDEVQYLLGMEAEAYRQRVAAQGN